MDNRVFYSVLEKVGGNGRYQTWSLVIWCIIIMVAGSSSFFNAFLFYQEDYYCQDQLDCHAYVCALPPEQRKAFVDPTFTSLASKFGDYRCGGEAELDRLQSFVYIGGIVGVIAGAFLSEVMTKKILMILTVGANLVGLVVVIIAPTLFVASIGLFVNFAAKCIQMEVIICFITEAVSEEIRGKHTIVIYILFAVGVTLNGLIFKLIPQWELVLIVYDLIPLLVSLTALIFYVQETPFDLIINYPPEHSHSVLQTIASRNGRESHFELTVDQVANIQKQYEQNQKKKHNYVISILDLFRFDSLRNVAIMSIILHFLTSFQFNAPELALKNYSLSVYLNGALIGFSEVVACVFCYFIVDHYERKQVIYITEAISLGISVPLFIFCSCVEGQDCSQTKQIMQTVGLFLFRFSITIAYNFFYMIQYEVFPNQIRALGLQTTAIASYTAVVLVPQVMALAERIGMSIVIAFAISCLLVVLAMLRMPQTFGVPPPEMIEELKYQHHEVDHAGDKIKSF